MARKRMIDPGIWQSEDFGALSNLAKIVFIALFSLADDDGRGRANPVYLRNTIFPYNEDLRSADVEKALSEISLNMSVFFYSCDGNKYYSLTNWEKWQKIDRPTPSKIPEYNENMKIETFVDYSTSVRRDVDEGSHPIEKNKKRIRIEGKENRKEYIVPFEDSVKEIYNRECFNLPQVKVLSDTRKKNIKKFQQTFNLEQFEEICKIANNSDFLVGKNDRGWKADFDFLMRVDKATSILEGKYSGKSNNFKTNNPFMEILEEEGVICREKI